MSNLRRRLPEIVDRLRSLYGTPKTPEVTDPFEMILYENIAYLLSDDKRKEAFVALQAEVGTTPEQILSAPHENLLQVAKHGGMQPERRVEKLCRIAQIALTDFDGDLNGLLKRPLAQARKALTRFPSIGIPGAEKILLFTRSYPILALESNGLRVLLRLGYGYQMKSYATTYRSVQEAVRDELVGDYDWMISAYHLLRRHGRRTCRRSRPSCDSCPLDALCAFNLSGLSRTDP